MNARMLVLVLTFIILGASARATQNELVAIVTSRSVAELNQRQLQSDRIQQLDDACEAELKAHALPRSCFAKMRGQPLTSRSIDEKSRLNRICVETARSSRSRFDLKDVEDDLPETCRDVARQRLGDLRYVDESAHPEMSVARTSGLKLE